MVLKVNLKYIWKVGDALFIALNIFCMRICWLTRLDLRHSRKVDGHYFLSLSTPVNTEQKKKKEKPYENYHFNHTYKLCLAIKYYQLS